MSDEIILTDGNFEEEVLKADIPVLVDFWAEWCGPCKMIAPTLEEIAVAYSGKAKVGKVNVDQNPGLAEKYGIRGIPTLIIFNKGEIGEQVVGVQPKETLMQLLDKYLS